MNHRVKLEDVQNDGVLIRLSCNQCGPLASTGNGMSRARLWARWHRKFPNFPVYQCNPELLKRKS
jgi:hypothetical protein